VGTAGITSNYPDGKEETRHCSRGRYRSFGRGSHTQNKRNFRHEKQRARKRRGATMEKGARSTQKGRKKDGKAPTDPSLFERKQKKTVKKETPSRKK